MRVAKYSLLTVLLLYLGMLYFGREAGLPEERIGRETSLWASLFGSGDEPGTLALLTEPEPEPAVAPGLGPIEVPATAIETAPEPAETQPAAAPVPEADPQAAPETPVVADSGVDPVAETEPVDEPLVASDLAPARTPRPPQRPERLALVAEAVPEPDDAPDAGPVEAETAPESDPVTAAIDESLAEEGLPEPVADAEPAALIEDPEPIETPELAETPLPETGPEAELVVASALAPEATLRPPPKPEPPVQPVALEAEPAEVDTAPAVTEEIVPEAPDVTPEPDPESPVVAAETPSDAEPTPEPAETAATAEPPADPAPGSAGDPVADAVAAALGPDPAEAAPGEDPSTEAEVAVDTLPEVGTTLADSPRPMPRPLQTLDPVPAADLAGVAVAAEPVVASEPEADPAVATVEDDAGPAPEADTEIAAAPLPEPEPEPIVPTLPEEPQGVLYVTASGVTVRAGPSESDRALDEMTRGSAVVDLGGQGDGWRMILLPNGAAGYILDRELAVSPGQ